MNEKTKATEAKAEPKVHSIEDRMPVDAAPPATPLDAIRAGLAAQAEVHTRFDASKYKRKEYDANGNEVPALPRT